MIKLEHIGKYIGFTPLMQNFYCEYPIYSQVKVLSSNQFGASADSNHETDG